MVEGAFLLQKNGEHYSKILNNAPHGLLGCSVLTQIGH